MPTPEICPNCGADVPARAKACPGCGSDQSTGWSDQAGSDHLDLPNQAFDYDDFVQREFAPDPVRPRGVRWLWWAVAVLLLAGFALMSWRSW